MHKMIKYYDTYTETKGGAFLDAVTSWHAWDRDHTTVRLGGDDFARIAMPVAVFEERIAAFANDEMTEVWDIRPQPKPKPVVTAKPTKGLMGHFHR